MSQISKYGPLVVVILIGIVLQVLLVFASFTSTPYNTAVAFTKAYFKLDPSMAEYLCEESKTIDDMDVVAGYIQHAASAAKDRARWFQSLGTSSIRETTSWSKCTITRNFSGPRS